MIIVRAPLRLSLGGGGTDIPDWYQVHGGSFISATIDKYIYLTGSERLVDKKFWLGYSKTEVCDAADEIQHSFLRACLTRYQFQTGVEIHSVSEVPGNSGLGSSGAFLVGCLTLLNAMKKIEMSRVELAELACRIEMVDLARSSGKQDQYASAIGGITRFVVAQNGSVEGQPLRLSPSTLRGLESSLFLYYSGVARSSESILAEQASSLRNASGEAVLAMHDLQKIGMASGAALEDGDLDAFGDLLHRHWLAKKRISSQISSKDFDCTYDFARSVGATGGKLIGAGGGGYWIFYVPPEKQRAFRAGIGSSGLVELPWKFEFHGCSVIFAN